jgi:hypothetical protein
MFTPKSTLPLGTLLCAMTLLGCEKPLDSPEYGELIYSVPPDLNRPYPLPELDPPTANPLPGPAAQEPASPMSAAAEPAASEPSAEPSTAPATKTATESKPATPPTDESLPKAEKNPE